MQQNPRSADFLVQSILSDPLRLEELKTDPAKVLKDAAVEANRVPVLESDPWVYRLVVGFLGTTVLGVVVGCIAYGLLKTGDLPSGLVALGSAAVGALAGLLAPSPRQST